MQRIHGKPKIDETVPTFISFNRESSLEANSVKLPEMFSKNSNT